MAAFAGIYVWFQKCSMKVVEVDGIYTKPAAADMLYFTAGQRYSVLLTIDHKEVNNIPFVASMDEVGYPVSGDMIYLTYSKATVRCTTR